MAMACAIVACCALSPLRAHAEETETLPLLVIVIEFDGGPDGATLYDDEFDWSATVFGGNDTPASYYLEMSDGLFTFSPARESSVAGVAGNHNAADRENDGVVHVTLPEAHEPWGLVNEDPAIARTFGQVMLRALDASRDFVDYGAYDGDGDGVLESNELIVCFCLAGYDASSLDDPGRTDVALLWPHTGYLTSGPNAVDAGNGPIPSSYIALAERIWDGVEPLEDAQQEPLGVLYHELGHSVGLPDLYAINPDPEAEIWGDYAVGHLSLMDSGGWVEAVGQDGGSRNAPMALDAWCRYILGWEMPQVITKSGNYEVRSQRADGGYQSLLIPTSDPDEFFIVENRQPEGCDEALPDAYGGSGSTGGIVIWHVDKGTYRQFFLANTINNTTHRPAVMEEYFEMLPDESGYSQDWAESVPNKDEPFYDSDSCARNYDDADAAVALPLYNDEPGSERPSARIGSGITLRFPSTSARTMTVSVEFATEQAGESSRAYPVEGERSSDAPQNALGAADVACAALLRETESDVAIVDGGSVRAGIPQGKLTWSDVYAVLPQDTSVITYTVTGEQLLQILEQAAPAMADPSGANGVAVGGVTCTIDEGAPTGGRVSDVKIGLNAIDANATYSIAATEGAAALYPTLASADRDPVMLWGSPADALRSFVLTPNWEQTAETVVGTKTYIAPPEPEQASEPEPAQEQERGIPLPVIVGVVAVVALGAFALVRLRRKA